MKIKETLHKVGDYHKSPKFRHRLGVAAAAFGIGFAWFFSIGFFVYAITKETFGFVNFFCCLTAIGGGVYFLLWGITKFVHAFKELRDLTKLLKF